MSIEREVTAVTEYLLDNPYLYSDGVSNPQLCSCQITRNPFSHTTKVVISCGDIFKSLYIKIPIIDEHNRDVVFDRLRDEYKHLQRVNDVFRLQDEFQVAAPVAYLDNIPALVTEEIPGQSLYDVIVKASRYFGFWRHSSNVNRLCQLAGNWLHCLHVATRCGTESVNLNQLVEYCQIRIDRLIEDDNCLVDEVFATKFQQYATKLAEQISPQDNFVSLRHNDFAPHNIIVTPNKIGVIDFTMCDTGDGFYDIAGFWERLETVGHDPMHDMKKIKGMQAAFLSGYGNSVKVMSARFRLGQCKYHVVNLASMIDQVQGSPYHRWRNRMLAEKSLTWLQREISQAR